MNKIFEFEMYLNIIVDKFEGAYLSNTVVDQIKNS
jgi:hypothetical protein